MFRLWLFRVLSTDAPSTYFQLPSCHRFAMLDTIRTPPLMTPYFHQRYCNNHLSASQAYVLKPFSSYCVWRVNDNSKVTICCPTLWKTWYLELEPFWGWSLHRQRRQALLNVFRDMASSATVSIGMLCKPTITARTFAVCNSLCKQHLMALIAN